MSIGKIDWLSIFFAVSASLIGVITLYGGGGPGEALAMKKLLWIAISIGVMFFFAFFNYQKLGSYSALIYIVTVVVLAATLLPFIGTTVKGARAWIRFFGMGFQPAELMKLALVIALSRYLVLRESEIGKLKELVIPAMIALIPALLIALQPDLGYAMVNLILLFGMLFIGGANTSTIFGFVIVGFAALFIPMYLEYSKFTIVDDIYSKLRDVNFRLADAVRILSFELWEYIEKPELVNSIPESNTLHYWAAHLVLKPENLTQIQTIANEIDAANPSLLRSFLRSDMALILTTAISAALYGVARLVYFATRITWVKKASTVALIIALSIGTAFAFMKSVNFKPHQVVRIVSFANPDKFPKGAGYQLRHSLITLGSGQVTGKGVFNGDMTRGDAPFLPEWYNDFIFSVIGEQFGFVGSAFTLLLLFALVFRGAAIALQSKDDFGSMLAAGITLIFFTHIVVNIGIAAGLLPVTGIPLVFVSSGGSNMLTSFMALGILLNIHRRRFINA